AGSGEAGAGGAWPRGDAHRDDQRAARHPPHRKRPGGRCRSQTRRRGARRVTARLPAPAVVPLQLGGEGLDCAAMKQALTSPFLDLPSVILKAHGKKRLGHGHPWVYSNEVEMDDAAKAVPPGGLVRLCDPQGCYLATVFFNRHTLIAARVLSRVEAVAIGTDFFAPRLRRALCSRERLIGAPFCRLVHAEADGLPGCIIDRFGDALSLQVNTAGMDLLTPSLIDAL